MNKRPPLESILLVGIVALAALLRFYALDGTSLWSDEGNTWALIQRSFLEIARDAAGDIHPPGYYWALKLWSMLFGVSAVAMRSFSAVAGVLTVWMVGRTARLFCSVRHYRILYAPLAALIAALNPFQIYYSQEARMYMLLALEATVVIWATVAVLRLPANPAAGRNRVVTRLAIYTAAATAGLWTHYSFPIVLAAAVAAYGGVWLWERGSARNDAPSLDGRTTVGFVAANSVASLLFLPWLPTAIRQVTSWPKGGEAIGLWNGIRLTFETLLVGPLDGLPVPVWPWPVAAAILPVIGAAALGRQRGSLAVILWLLGPVGLMFGLGLFSEAFLKFLLVASPAWCLLVAAAPHVVSLERRPDDLRGREQTTAATRIGQALIGLSALLVALYVLPGYYNSAVRDDYRSVAAYLAAVADPATDLVLLTAPGQQDVWGYYDPGIPTLALPAERPADQAETEAALAAATGDSRRVYALFWATDEADPKRIIESWLDRHAFKGPERWQGNVRFVTYRIAPPDGCLDLATPLLFGDFATLATVCGGESTVPAGDLLPITLVWRARADGDVNYAVSVQLQDGLGRVIAQHDGPPAGGSHPTSTWRTGDEIGDNHSLLIPFGTPPGSYRLAVALYDPVSGMRVGESAQTGTVTVERTEQTVPVALLPIVQRVGRALGPVTLVGYSAHGLGYAHAPATPIPSGAPVEVILYWQAPDPLPAEWPESQEMRLSAGDDQQDLPIVAGYPTDEWQAGEIVRSVIVLPHPGADRAIYLRIGTDQVTLEPPPTLVR